MKEIWKKIAPEFFEDVEKELKNFKIRKDVFWNAGRKSGKTL